jgi:hypothetical protein
MHGSDLHLTFEFTFLSRLRVNTITSQYISLKIEGAFEFEKLH